MHRLIFASVFAIPMFLSSPASVAAQQTTSVCGTGPYIVSLTSTGVLPSVRKQIAGIGLAAKIGGCMSFEVVCALKDSTSADDADVAKKEAQKGCAALRTALLTNSVSKNSPLSASLNQAMKEAVKIIFKPATTALPAGKASIVVGSSS